MRDRRCENRNEVWFDSDRGEGGSNDLWVRVARATGRMSRLSILNAVAVHFPRHLPR